MGVPDLGHSGLGVNPSRSAKRSERNFWELQVPPESVPVPVPVPALFCRLFSP